MKKDEDEEEDEDEDEVEEAHFSRIHCLKKVVTDGRTNRRTDGGIKPLIEMRGRI